MKFKVNDLVVIISNYLGWNCINEYRERKDLKNQIGKIIYIDFDDYYLIEILNCSYKKECKYFKKKNYCCFWRKNEIKSINSLKLKKLIKHGV